MVEATGRFQLAQVNVARLAAPLDSPQLKAFVDGLEPVNAVAEAADGFVWRLVGDAGVDATDLRVLGDEWMMINMSVWRDPESLKAFMYAGQHRELMARRREFFERLEEAATALWWVPAGSVPTVGDAEERLRHLRAHGPTAYAFSLRQLFAAPGAGAGAEAAEEGGPLGAPAVEAPITTVA